MMKHTRTFSLTLAAVLALGTAACSDNDADENKAADVATHDLNAPVVTDSGAPVDATAAAADTTGATFLTDAMMGNNSEIKLGELAASKGSSQAVKDFGKMLAADHRKAQQDVTKLATTLNVPATEATNPDADAAMTRLNGLSGAEFDKEFASHMVEDHNKDIAKFQQETQSGDPQAVKDLATATLPTLKKHLKAAEALRK